MRDDSERIVSSSTTKHIRSVALVLITALSLDAAKHSVETSTSLTKHLNIHAARRCLQLVGIIELHRYPLVDADQEKSCNVLFVIS